MDRSYGAVVFDTSGNGTDEEPRYLIVHHANGQHWGFTKGHREGVEKPMETARREIAEEAGISVTFVDGFSTEASWILPEGRPKIVRYFLARYTGPCRDPLADIGNEILDTLWLPYSACRDKLSYQSARDVLDQAQSFISRAFLQKNATHPLPD